jgi:nitrite reductase (NO-forming)
MKRLGMCVALFAFGLLVVMTCAPSVRAQTKAPPPSEYKQVSALVQLPDFLPGLGALYVKPDTLWVGPYLAYDRGSWQSVGSAPPEIAAHAAPTVPPFSPPAPHSGAGGRDATLPALVSTGDVASVTLTASDATVAIVDGIKYQAWTFDNTVPGPVLHVRQGQRIHITFANRGSLPHSLDLHAAEVPPEVAYRDIAPGETLDFSFVARTPGVFVYHCGTPPVLLHTGNGMYGAMVVDPVQPLPPADASYVLVQSEWYTRQLREGLLAGDIAKMQAGTPDYVAFNGIAFQYRDHPLAAKAGQRIRLYLANAGPSLTSAFHVIGAMFSAVYPDGDAAHALTGVSTYLVAPGQGVVFDLIIPQGGTYPFVDHSLRNQLIGAIGVLDVAP